MEVKIDKLIEKLKKEGVEGAQQMSDDILAKARKEAADIVARARQEARDLVDQAGKEAASFEENSKRAIEQAARDGELLLKGRVETLFETVFKQEVSETMTPEFLKTLIVKLVENWGKNNEKEVEVSKADLKMLEDLLFKGVREELKKGITLKAGKDLMHGFRIGIKGENVYYDFTDESIAEILKRSLNARIKELLEAKHG
ncbi:hypothetical protein JW948_09875 [bacterium]|nr:hypothetical protein [bacterium]